MQIAEKFTVPDECPENCIYKNDLEFCGMDAVCMTCPVFVCNPKNPCIDPKGYRQDWAAEWEKFFKTGEKRLLDIKHAFSTIARN